VDESGAVTFKDTPPPASGKSSKVKVYKESDFDPAPPPQSLPVTRRLKTAVAPPAQAPASSGERFSGTVEIYVTEWCGYCKQAQRYMNSRGISYVAYDIEKDSSAKKRHKELGGRGVPLIIIGSNRMSGFSPETLEYYLNNSR
jgi:glutaredoxin-like YruB-family protein